MTIDLQIDRGFGRLTCQQAGITATRKCMNGVGHSRMFGNAVQIVARPACSGELGDKDAAVMPARSKKPILSP